jgi:hypothetical protein
MQTTNFKITASYVHRSNCVTFSNDLLAFANINLYCSLGISDVKYVFLDRSLNFMDVSVWFCEHWCWGSFYFHYILPHRIVPCCHRLVSRTSFVKRIIHVSSLLPFCLPTRLLHTMNLKLYFFIRQLSHCSRLVDTFWLKRNTTALINFIMFEGRRN